MKKTLTVLLIAILVAFINRIFSFLGSLNLVWIVGFALFFAWRGVYGTLFIVVAGLLNDLLLHEKLGITSLSIMLALVIVVFLESIIPRFDTTSINESIISLLVAIFLGFLISNSIMMIFLYDSHLGSLNVSVWIYQYLITSFLSVLIFLLFRRYGAKSEGLKRVKI